jgi:beta-glucosidase
MRCLSIINYLLFVSVTAHSQVYKDPVAPVEARVNDLLAQMTPDEKLDYIGGDKHFYIRSIPRLGLPEIKMTDGPVGTRNDGKTTAYPASVLSAASWDTALVKRLGIALGRDSRARGVHILLAPGVNIYRAPMAGRSFEYLGEDPYLAGRMAVSYINGVQSQGVAATVKHFAANNQEWDRNHVSSDMDERTLQEIYLPAFKAAVQEAKVGAVMNSYNLINGVHATQHDHLNNRILKGDWQFDGILMSDWVATYDGVAAALGGLDLEMPSGAFMNKATLLPAIQNGTVPEAVINDKVKRILRIIFRFGFYDHVQKDAAVPLDDPRSAQAALDLARSGIVLLKNEQHLLPLSPAVRSIVLIGPNADKYIAGGGSSYTQPFHSVSLLKGIQTIGTGTKLTYIKDNFSTIEDQAPGAVFYTRPGSAVKGLNAEYFNNSKLEGAPVATVIEKTVNHIWSGKPGVNGIGADNFSIRYTGVIRPAASGNYKIAVKGDDGFRLFVNDQKIIDQWHDQAPVMKSAIMRLEANKEYTVKLEYYENAGGSQISFTYYLDAIDFSEAVQAASAADIAIVSVGFNQTSEGEGSDRSFTLPEYQDTLISAIAKANPNTIVVLNAGGNVDMQKWLPSVKGLIHAWFPGQEGGTAIAELLFGKINPSGKLPISMEKRWEDNPAFNYYYDEDKDKKVFYKEGLYTGYRYYDSSTVKPLFPFGFGLSYTSFEYSGLEITGDRPANFSASFNIKNTGNYDGAETAQLYIHQVNSPVARPEKELKGFTKLFLKKGETKKVTIPLSAAAFSYYKKETNAFGYDKGTFNILVGASSSQILLKGSVDIR